MRGEATLVTQLADALDGSAKPAQRLLQTLSYLGSIAGARREKGQVLGYESEELRKIIGRGTVNRPLCEHCAASALNQCLCEIKREAGVCDDGLFDTLHLFLNMSEAAFHSIARPMHNEWSN